MTRLVLGSASAGRLKVLRQAGIDPLVRVSGVDEDLVAAGLGPDAAPDVVVGALAQAKAAQVAGLLTGTESPNDLVASDCVVVGCDSMLYLDGRLLGKPATTDDARQQWQAMSGRSGRLYTGHCLIRLQDSRAVFRETQTSFTTVHFGTPSPADLEAYLDSGESLRVAGGFTLDGLGGWFIDGIDGDPSAVVGIGLPLMRALLSRAGLSLAAMWAANPLS
jgi:septum formation protein